MNIIGDREIFGIEYLIQKAEPILPYGHCRIWMSGNFLGDIDNTIFLTSTCSELEGLIKNRHKFILEREFLSDSKQEIFIFFDKKTTKDYGFIYIEGYDAFSKYVYYQKNSFHFFWMLEPYLQGKEDYKSFPQDLCSATIALSLYEEVVVEFRKALNNFLDLESIVTRC